jgi:integrase/recombinase XerD
MEPIRRRKNSLTIDNTTAVQRSFTFEELINLFSIDRQIKNCTSRTIQFYEENLHYLQKVYEIKGMLLDISFITPNHLKSIVIGYMMEKGLSSFTINGRMKTYKAFFKFLFQEGYRHDDISATIPLVKSDHKLIPSFNKQQALQLLNQPNRNTFVGLRDYSIMMLLLETGIRIQELLSLQIQDVVFSENELRVHIGKGRKARRVPFQKTCANVLKMYIRERGDLQTNVLFVTLDNRPMHPRTIQENIHEYGKKAKISGVASLSSYFPPYDGQVLFIEWRRCFYTSTNLGAQFS